MTKEMIIEKTIEKGIFEADGYRYVLGEWVENEGVYRTVKRIGLESLNKQYDEELKCADEITGWEEIYSGFKAF